MGELDDTLIVVSGDHGIPGFPRGKCNLYDFGVHVALAVRWGDIDTIILFRREFETKDCVCMSLEGEGEVLGEINEEMTGWNDVVTALPAQFDGVMPANQWQDAIRRPHRRPRPTVIYDGRRSLDD